MDSSYANEPLNQVSLWNTEKDTTEQDQIKTCSTALKYYKIRRVNNKGALVVILLSFLVTSTLYLFPSLSGDLYAARDHSYLVYLWVIPYAVSASLTGLLADIFIRRYSMVKISVWMTWLFMIISTIIAVVAQFTTPYYKSLITKKMLPITFNAMGIGLGGFHVNIIQFGLDQLHDASTAEIITFITWFASTIFSSGFVVTILSFLNNEYYNPSLIFLFIVCLFLTMAVLLLVCCNHLLIKEPPSKNPFRLIYNVIRFAIKNKHPRCRSAFTYCEDELPSRIDFGKSKYGGPFTTEQVEDVKTFFRILTLIITFAILILTIIGAIILYSFLTKLHLHNNAVSNVLTVDITSNTVASFGVTLLIVLHEIIVYPPFHRCTLPCCKGIKSLSKVTYGILLHLLSLITLMVLNVMSRHIYLNSNGYNATLQCDLYESNGILFSTFNSQWYFIPNFLQVTAILFFVIGIIEFLSSQSPYAMKGLIFGMLFTTMFITFFNHWCPSNFTLPPTFLNLEYKTNQLWILVHTDGYHYLLHCFCLPFLFNKKVQNEAEKRRCVAKRTHFC